MTRKASRTDHYLQHDCISCCRVRDIPDAAVSTPDLGFATALHLAGVRQHDHLYEISLMSDQAAHPN